MTQLRQGEPTRSPHLRSVSLGFLIYGVRRCRRQYKDAVLKKVEWKVCSPLQADGSRHAGRGREAAILYTRWAQRPVHLWNVKHGQGAIDDAHSRVKMSNEVFQEITQTQAPPDMLWIPGGTFLMGSEDFYPEEGPVHEVSVDGFWIDRHIVTNEQFARFVKATGYVTVAERELNPADYPGALAENLVPGALVFQKAHPESSGTR
jgi:formylglycine-generating enzyme required for sulfatase activity